VAGIEVDTIPAGGGVTTAVVELGENAGVDNELMDAQSVMTVGMKAGVHTLAPFTYKASYTPNMTLETDTDLQGLNAGAFVVHIWLAQMSEHTP
jgi:hypothetical protein